MRDLKKSGIKIVINDRVYFGVFNTRINYRNHRKATVIDGKVGFVGGLNLADEYNLGKAEKYGFFRDTHLVIEGSAVKSLTQLFFRDLYYCTNEFISDVYNEIETNGTIVIEDELFNNLTQINCSPKLANSGMTEKQRIVPAAIKRIMEHANYQFKFVISTEDDVLELFRDFVEPFNIPLKNVVCMPGLDDASNFEERTRFVMEMAKKYRFRGLTRLHIAAWDKTLNV